MAFYVELTARAKEDLEDAAGWYAQHSRDKALLWMIGCQEATESLANSPSRCQIAPESRDDEREIRHLLYDQHRILFEIEDETVTVLHIRHQKRQPFEMDDI
ncbi:MAG: type II toxin-antitoxin system RelE/ParE family toxin [Acidobacteriota bacterium]|nr:type II toxin-antitoxin system RelE/ParE family toxin [Acidobacteriota bacterium]